MFSKQILEDYFAFLRFKSISSEPEFSSQVNDCAIWLKQYLEESCFQVELWEGDGFPVVFGRNMQAGPDKPTVLLYGHYDVQPVDPLELWTSPPFEPVQKGDVVFARGAQDNKGQTMYVIAALRAMAAEPGGLPVNVKICLDGEEESGSFNLKQQLKAKQGDLSADYMAIVDLGMFDENHPTVSLGVRGMSAITVVVTGSDTDLHSGVHGGIVYNPNHALVEILASLRDKSGRITVPGFYDEVTELSEDIRSRLWSGIDAATYEQVFGARATGGEKAYPLTESASTRPTLEINGIAGGYAGDGFKTVIPAKAVAKISCRLVPNQDPDRIRQLLIDYIRELTPDGVTVDFPAPVKGGKPVRSNPDSKIVKAVVQAYGEISGVQAGYHLEGGSVPIIADMLDTTGAELVMMGWGLIGDNMHAPNESFSLQRMQKGFITIARMLEIMGGDTAAET
ncbi:M20/M25/M40 family metallo-hydrolase [bacterium]|nr:M20/M25/M40 family metallo-hydrolase [bacterium]